MGLREFMRVLLGQSNVILNSPNVVKNLVKITGLASPKIYDYLDKLDIKFIRVKWSGGGRPLGIEILRMDYDSIPEKQKPELAPKQPKVRQVNWRSIVELPVPRQKLPAVRECATCHDVKKIKSGGKCGKCLSREFYNNLPLGICSKCNKQKKIYPNGICSSCRAKYTGPLGICIVCQMEKPILAKGKCYKCYHGLLPETKKNKYKQGQTGICQVCKIEKRIYTKDTCYKCYNPNRKNGICVGCQTEKPILAKNRCTSCYPK